MDSHKITQEIITIWNVNLTQEQMQERINILDSLESLILTYKREICDDIFGLGIYGSFLRNSFNEKSDIDIAILYNTVTDSTDHERLEKRTTARQWFSREISRATNYTVDEYGTMSPFPLLAQDDYNHISWMYLLPSIITSEDRKLIDDAIVKRLESVPDEEKKWFWAKKKFDYDNFVGERFHHQNRIGEDYKELIEMSQRYPGGIGASYKKKSSQLQKAYFESNPEFNLDYVSNDPRFLTGFNNFVLRARESGTHF